IQRWVDGHRPGGYGPLDGGRRRGGPRARRARGAADEPGQGALRRARRDQARSRRLLRRRRRGADADHGRAAGAHAALPQRRREPDLITAAWWKEERGERIFVDYNQNAPHKTVFGAWSVRARPGAQVSTPLSWDEVFERHPDELTLATVAGRDDPWAEMYKAP